MRRLSLTTRVLIALAAGIGLGLGLSASGSPAALRVVDIVAPVGTLFINAIRMTVIPLIVSLVIVGIAGADVRAIGRLGGRAAVVAVSLLSLSALLGALAAPPVFARVQIDPAAIAAFRARAAEGFAGGTSAGAGSIAEGARKLPGIGQWLTDLVPSNPIRAAADGAMLPLILFAIAFGLALASLAPEKRDPLLRFFRSVADAMLRLVRWILELAPIGVFALALPLVARLGISAIGALATYVGLIVALTVVFVAVVVYPAAVIFGRVSPMQFARALLPAQAVAFSSRSSLAALPALIEGAQHRLGLSADASGFLLPLASALFRIGAAVGLVVGTAFVGWLYGVDLSSTQIATVAIVSVLTSFSIPGIPAGSIIVMVPVLASVGLPAEGIGVLLGVDTIPDAFRTTANVSGQMALAAIAGRESEAVARATMTEGAAANPVATPGRAAPN